MSLCKLWVFVETFRLWNFWNYEVLKNGGPQNGGVKGRRVSVGSVESLDPEEWEMKDHHEKTIMW